MRYSSTSLVLSLAILGLLGWLLVDQRGEPDPAAIRLKAGQQTQPAFAASLQDTQPDGDLKTQQHELVVNPELVYLFDYYLATLGERQLPEIVAEVRRALAQKLQLQPHALAQALDLFARYLNYKRALTQATDFASAATGSQAAMMQQRWQFMSAKRAAFFAPSEIAALFADEETRYADAYQRMLIFENTALSQAQKQTAYAALDQALTPAQLAEKNAPVFIQQIEQQVAELRARGADEQTVYQFRALNFSADAAARLSELEREEQAWQARIANYQQQAQTFIQATRSTATRVSELSPAQQLALTRLREQSFTEQERLRLAAYEKW